MKVEFKDPNGQFTYFDIRISEVTVGRSRRCHIVLANDSLSREHLKITCREGVDPVVMDLGSSNGTYINDKKLTPNMPEAFTPLFPFSLGNGISMRILEDAEEFPEDANIQYIRDPAGNDSNSTKAEQLDSPSQMNTYVLSQPKKRRSHTQSRKIVASGKKKSKTGKDKNSKGNLKEKMNPMRMILIALIAILAYLYLLDG